ILEGLNYLPDLSGAGGVRTITGTPQLQLTTVGVDGKLSKNITIASSSTFTPYVGYQFLWIFGDSGMIDLTPNTDPIESCGYKGQNLPGTDGAPGGKGYDGQPVCSNGNAQLDFNNTVTFHEVRLQRQRIMAGFNFRYEMVSIGFQYLTDIVSPGKMNKQDNLDDVPMQYTISGHIGAIF
ncbi:MAG: hypothetical protein FWD57_06130, partial [Polyangiaceae bacterium]|nr:hypothetical protein [Polyangiaceae bacterium]